MSIHPAPDSKHRDSDADKRSQALETAFTVEDAAGSTAANAERSDNLPNRIEQLLDAADEQSQATSACCSHEEIFGSLRRTLSAHS